MADRFVRSTNGSDGGGTSWADAKQTFAGVAGIDTAGDTIFVSDAHAEETAGNVNCVFQGTAASPTRIICCDDADATPVSLALTALVKTTGTSTITIQGTIYCYGVRFQAGDSIGSSVIDLGVNQDRQVYEKCIFEISSTGVNGRIRPTASVSTSSAVLTWKDVDIRLANASQRIACWNVNFHWNGGSILSGSAAITALLGASTRFSRMLLESLDLSNGATSMDIVVSTSADMHLVIRNSRPPSGWNGNLIGGTVGTTVRAEMYNCDAGDTTYRIWIKDYAGDLIQETTLVRSSGASDGTTALSWKVTTTANCDFETSRFYSPEIVRWNETTGSAITVAVEILHDSLTALKDDEVWLEVQYLGTSGYPIGTSASDAKANALATGAAQDSSSETWTTTGLTNPTKQKLSVTFAPQEKGFIQARICFGKAGPYTVYVDPMLNVS